MMQAWKGFFHYHRYTRARVTPIIGEPFPSLQARASDILRDLGRIRSAVSISVRTFACFDGSGVIDTARAAVEALR